MLEITKDGLTFVIEQSLPLGCVIIEALLRQDQDGYNLMWNIKNTESSYQSYNLGRRNQWQKALSDALIFIENKLRELDK